MGRGFRRAARYYLQEVLPEKLIPISPSGHGDVGEEDYKEEKFDGDHMLEPDVEIPAEESFYVLDIGAVISQLYQWRKNFPSVYPYYAVKCNPDPLIVRALAILVRT